MTVHILWLNAGLSCDGDSVSLTAATLPSVEGIERYRRRSAT
jgi:hydrogenase small subunit